MLLRNGGVPPAHGEIGLHSELDATGSCIVKCKDDSLAKACVKILKQLKVDRDAGGSASKKEKEVRRHAQGLLKSFGDISDLFGRVGCF